MLVDLPVAEDAGPAAPSAEPPAPAPRTPLISIDEAKERIGSGVLKILDEKFKGSLAGVRHPDERDHFF